MAGSVDKLGGARTRRARRTAPATSEDALLGSSQAEQAPAPAPAGPAWSPRRHGFVADLTPTLRTPPAAQSSTAARPPASLDRAPLHRQPTLPPNLEASRRAGAAGTSPASGFPAALLPKAAARFASPRRRPAGSWNAPPDAAHGSGAPPAEPHFAKYSVLTIAAKLLGSLPPPPAGKPVPSASKAAKDAGAMPAWNADASGGGRLGQAESPVLSGVLHLSRPCRSIDEDAQDGDAGGEEEAAPAFKAPLGGGGWASGRIVFVPTAPQDVFSRLSAAFTEGGAPPPTVKVRRRRRRARRRATASPTLLRGWTSQERGWTPPDAHEPLARSAEMWSPAGSDLGTERSGTEDDGDDEAIEQAIAALVAGHRPPPHRAAGAAGYDAQLSVPFGGRAPRMVVGAPYESAPSYQSAESCSATETAS